LVCCSAPELALKQRFGDVYGRSTHPVMRAIEREVCGCDFGGNSWTNRAQVDEQIRMLGLSEKSRLVDLGAGTGWPGLYMAQQTGCTVDLVDLPEIGLEIARKRAVEDGLSNRVTTCIADAADLPYPASSFDAISHSDLLCCLVRKRAVLDECRRIIRTGGSMVFTVISIAPGLDRSDQARAVANAPEFVVSDGDYRTLLDQSGWLVTGHWDLTPEYEASCSHQIKAEDARRKDLADLLGAREAEIRIADWRSKLQAIQDGLFLRELFCCQPQAPTV